MPNFHTKSLQKKNELHLSILKLIFNLIYTHINSLMKQCM